MGYVAVALGMLLFGTLLWVNHRIRSWLEARGQGTRRTESQALAEAEVYSRTHYPFV